MADLAPRAKVGGEPLLSRVSAPPASEEDEKDMRKPVTRFVRERRKAHLNAKASTVPAAQLVVAEEAASSNRLKAKRLWLVVGCLGTGGVPTPR
eukprot:jgi/Tetstr1/445868/TSEL_033507.t1